jgi:DNA-binding NarL/FixJ family response regulator
LVFCCVLEVTMLSARILVVEDFDPWRRLISSMLEKEPHLHIICEVSDGVEAVQKAKELHPDLILLDIGLPKLNGIEAARQIRRSTPKSKILFLSQESAAAVVREALRFGAGFVVKADAGRELLSAVKAVILGEPFLSSALTGHTFEAAPDRLVPEGLQ